jgi:hypothetical protein
MRKPHSYAEYLAVTGRPLTDAGVLETALSRTDALVGVDVITREMRPIFGGDVWIDRHGRIEHSHSVWTADPRVGEPRETYVRRSWEIARKFITEYPEPRVGHVWFVLVVGDP